jgi:hypothetical protein
VPGPGTSRRLPRLAAVLLLAGMALLSACTDGAPTQAPGEPAPAPAPPAPTAAPTAAETNPGDATPVPAAQPTPPPAAPGAALPQADPTPRVAAPTPGRSSARPPEELKHITVSVSGRVESVTASDGTITFDEAVHGFERVMVVEDTEILSPGGDPGSLDDITSGAVVLATGAPDGQGGIIARSIKIESS